MKIGELAKRTGLSPHTIRYYERIGLLPFADRDAGGRRDYDESILTWIEFLGRLKTTGMPIRAMQRCVRKAIRPAPLAVFFWNSIATGCAPIWLNCRPAFSSSTSRSTLTSTRYSATICVRRLRQSG